MRKDSVKWSDKEDDLLRNNYKSKGIDYCVMKLNGRTRQAVMARASKLNLNCGRYWTEKEIEYFENNSHYPNTYIAKKLHKTTDNVKKVRYNLGLGRCEDNKIDSITIAEISRLVGIRKDNLSKTWVRHGLKTHKSGRNRVATIKNFLLFMKEHTDLWNASKCEEWYFSKYDWFQEKRKQDFKRMVEERWGDQN